MGAVCALAGRVVNKNVEVALRFSGLSGYAFVFTQVVFLGKQRLLRGVVLDGCSSC
jgi:hypothetical protein